MIRSNFKILGVDPGTNITGYSIVECNSRTCKMITCGIFELSKHDNHQTKLKEVFLQLQEVIETFLPGHMAIEAPFYGKNVQSMLKLGRAQGVAMAAAMTMGVDIFEYAPKKIKQAITGNGNASKEQVLRMLESRLNISLDAKLLDASDALAAAVCHFQRISIPGQGASRNKYRDWKSYVKANQDKIG